MTKCEHGRQKQYCKECGGSQICEHGKRKSICKLCHGSQICEHNRLKQICKECGGSGICEHNDYKARCKKCKGGSICKHSKRKSRCKECGGSELCKSEWCEMTKIKNYEGYCLFCYIHLFPDTLLTKKYKTKELAIVESIKLDFPELTWVMDKKILDGCSKRRPDILLDLGYQVIIIEIDEHQHNKYDTTCENKRIMEISQDLGHRPFIFIIFNPDDYIINNKKITSCWGNNKNGILDIKKSKQTEWDNRIFILKEQVKYWYTNISIKTVEIIYLFYNVL